MGERVIIYIRLWLTYAEFPTKISEFFNNGEQPLAEYHRFMTSP